MDCHDQQPQFAQLLQPAGQQLAADRHDALAAIRQRLAHGQMQLVDVLGQQFLGGIGQRLLHPARLAGRQTDGEEAADLRRQDQADGAGRAAVAQRLPAPGLVLGQPVHAGLGVEPGRAIGGQEKAIHG